VYIQNQATANLYYYTPYQPNAASLRAGYGEGDGCSTYGNRNFYQYFNDWFGSTQYIATDTAFVDVSTSSASPAYSVFASDIVWLTNTGITNGWMLPDGSKEYRPSAAVTRDVLAALLYRLAGQPEFSPPNVSPFEDVPTGYTFYKEITWLASSGISEGWQTADQSREFRPTEPVTRDVFAAFLYRVAQSPSFSAPADSPFIDVGVDHVFYDEIAWLAERGISAGWSVGAGEEFRPSVVVTRDVIAAFLHRLHGYLNGFADVASSVSAPTYSVFAPQIAWLSATGISTGWATDSGQREYRPAQTVTRDVMAAFLYRLAGQPAFSQPSKSPFVDVPTDYVFYKEITWLASTGVSTGWLVGSNVEFRPTAPVTRDVMAAFLYRFAGAPAFTAPPTSPFVDVSQDHPFFKDMSWLASTKISTGWATDGIAEFRPSAPVTRDVMAAFLDRLQRLLDE
jgi:hypothetical protein